MAPAPLLLLPSWGAVMPGENGRPNCPLLMLTPPGVSLQSAPTMPRQLPQDKGGKQAGASSSGQAHRCAPILRRLQESAAGMCLAVTTMLSETRQKPVCAESHPERIPWCAFIVACQTPPSDLLHKKTKVLHTLPTCYCPLGCHETLCSGQGLWKMYKSFLGR